MLLACFRCCALPSWYMILTLAVIYGLALCDRPACSLVLMIVPTYVTHSLLPSVTCFVSACVTQSRCSDVKRFHWQPLFSCSVYITQVPISATYTPYFSYCVIRPHPIRGTLPACFCSCSHSLHFCTCSHTSRHSINELSQE